MHAASGFFSRPASPPVRSLAALPTAGAATRRQKLKAKRASDRRRFHKRYRDRVPQPIAFAGPLPRERVPLFPIPEILCADTARRNESIGACIVEAHE